MLCDFGSVNVYAALPDAAKRALNVGDSVSYDDTSKLYKVLIFKWLGKENDWYSVGPVTTYDFPAGTSNINKNVFATVKHLIERAPAGRYVSEFWYQNWQVTGTLGNLKQVDSGFDSRSVSVKLGNDSWSFPSNSAPQYIQKEFLWNGGDLVVAPVAIQPKVFSYVSPNQSAYFKSYFTAKNYEVYIYRWMSKTEYDSFLAGLKDQQFKDEMLEQQETQTQVQAGILEKISNFFAGFFDNLGKAISSLFIPEKGYFEDYFKRLNDFFAQKLGMLYAPVDMFIKVLDAINNASTVESPINFSGVKWGSDYIIPPQSFRFSDIGKQFPDIVEKLHFVTNVVMIGAVLHLLQNKLKEVLTT